MINPKQATTDETVENSAVETQSTGLSQVPLPQIPENSKETTENNSDIDPNQIAAPEITDETVLYQTELVYAATRPEVDNLTGAKKQVHGLIEETKERFPHQDFEVVQYFNAQDEVVTSLKRGNTIIPLIKEEQVVNDLTVEYLSALDSTSKSTLKEIGTVEGELPPAQVLREDSSEFENEVIQEPLNPDTGYDEAVKQLNAEQAALEDVVENARTNLGSDFTVHVPELSVTATEVASYTVYKATPAIAEIMKLEDKLTRSAQAENEQYRESGSEQRKFIGSYRDVPSVPVSFTGTIDQFLEHKERYEGDVLWNHSETLRDEVNQRDLANITNSTTVDSLAASQPHIENLLQREDLSEEVRTKLEQIHQTVTDIIESPKTLLSFEAQMNITSAVEDLTRTSPVRFIAARVTPEQISEKVNRTFEVFESHGLK